MRKVDIRITITEEFDEPVSYGVAMTREGIEGAIQMASGQEDIEARALRDFLHRSIEDAVVNWANASPGAKRFVERRKLERELGGPITADNLIGYINKMLLY